MVIQADDHFTAFFAREGGQRNDDLLPNGKGGFLFQSFRFSIQMILFSQFSCSNYTNSYR